MDIKFSMNCSYRKQYLPVVRLSQGKSGTSAGLGIKIPAHEAHGVGAGEIKIKRILEIQ